SGPNALRLRRPADKPLALRPILYERRESFMSRRFLTLLLLVGLLLAGGLQTAAAKPPDLPADLTDTCAPQPWEGLSEDMLIGAGVYAAFGVPAVAVLDLYGLTAQPDNV